MSRVAKPNLSQQEIADIAKDLNVSAESVVFMNYALNGRSVSFHQSGEEGEERVYSPESYLGDDRYRPDRTLEDGEEGSTLTSELNAALNSLTERERFIITSRWLQEKKMKLNELADRYGVSAERIRQIEAAAKKKIRDHIGEDFHRLFNE